MKASLFSALIMIATSLPAHAQHVEYSTEVVRLEPEVSVESVSRDGADFEIVHLKDGESFEIPVELNQDEFAAVRPEEIAAYREDAREILELTLNQVLSEEFNGEMVSGQDGLAVALKAEVDGEPVKRDGWLKRAFTINPELNKPMPKGLSVTAKIKRFSQNAWQFIFVETVHAGIDYVRRFKKAPKMVEFGFSADIKVEPQIFIGKFNPTQKVKALRNSYGLALELSFNKQTKRLAIHTRLRREKGSGGLGLPAAKVEFKIFETDGTHGVQGGRSWYPVSPPLASFVLDRDHAGHYFAQGITFGLNTGDLIPGSTLTNTFADYQQVQDPIKMKNLMKRKPVLTCEALFR